ncbi:MAG: deoxyguanosinetriphosphate triphosphohydrolase [Candidatus Omnitrophica bacterium]|nr:deoxyguanosinetriphosphate triphosphohydrolase [Candidatus Omnitrophota bacterium]MDD5352288.1 deoxyguanosinetriphosphate triphosphohydrolase [Candidatus Omnitrophota bacterium]MDD5549886.1 deoxyguanosinetriphosphate triphosphohydrolase [Candidatus Omnitrophota bacterium]
MSSHNTNLANYAMHENESRGRKFREKEHPYRSIYQRDRDRIIHSAAFRRLEYKTQVFVYHEGDYYRTRLTHTIEVSQIARTIAKVLRLNEDLVEAIALAHDLGHTPFGHAGEEALNTLMKGHGGFNHNNQTLRIVDVLEERYPNFNGLNLTWEVREGIAKHSTKYDTATQTKEFHSNKMPTLEAQVVDIADEIAYDNHDLDDGITSGLINEEALKDLTLWKETNLYLQKEVGKISPTIQKYQVIRLLINILVSDLIKESQKNISAHRISGVKDVRNAKKKLITFSKEIARKRIQLRTFLLDNLYKHYRVIRMADKAKRFIDELFKIYIRKPQALPQEFRLKLERENKYRVVCDYIAGMTDRCALDEHKKLFDPYEKV